MKKKNMAIVEDCLTPEALCFSRDVGDCVYEKPKNIKSSDGGCKYSHYLGFHMACKHPDARKQAATAAVARLKKKFKLP